MPPIEESQALISIVTWEKVGVDRFCDYAVNGPRQITIIRWEAVSREALSPEGNKVTITADLMVNEQIPIGTIVWRGTLNDLPDNPTNLFQVISYDETDDLKQRYKQRNVSLMRYMEQLPQSVGTGTI